MPPESTVRVQGEDGEGFSPSRYLERVDLSSGEVIPGPIRPEELLVASHRDVHPVDIHARYMTSRMVRATGSEEAALSKLRHMRALGRRIAVRVSHWTGRKDPEAVAEALFGLKTRHRSFRFKIPRLPAQERWARLESLRLQAAAQLERAATEGGLHLLLTGGTGFIGKELLAQLAGDPSVAEVVVLVRPKRVRRPEGGGAAETLGARERGRELLDQLCLPPGEARERFHFLEGDVEKPHFGLDPEVLDALARRLTHVIHCAASVAFDAPYEESFQANVLGTLEALRFSRTLQQHPDSAFVAHLAVETSYIHGRQQRGPASENELVFPPNYYNNYYELTKAMASVETERFLLEEGLRVVQLCPSIVIGESRTGNNRGDTKVVNAPVNVFGRAADLTPASWAEWPKTVLMARLGRVFPGDPTAQFNLVSVDRVAAGILAALRRPEAVGERIHLANDRRISAVQMGAVIREELEVEVKLVDPTLHRTVGLPLVRTFLRRLGQERVARLLDRMNAVFSGYAEWGQPLHQVGKDVKLLGLPPSRPDPERAFRMLCRHNRYVQEYGRIKDLGEISRRESLWREFIEALEGRLGSPAAALPAERFREEVESGPCPYRPGA